MELFECEQNSCKYNSKCLRTWPTKSENKGKCRLMLHAYKKCIANNFVWHTEFKEKVYQKIDYEKVTLRNFVKSTKALLSLVKKENPYIEKTTDGYKLQFSTGILYCKGAVADAVLPAYITKKEGFFY